MLESRAAFVLASLFLAAWLVVNLWPASWWMTVRGISVAAATTDQPVEIIFDRTIHRPASILSTVRILRWDDQGWVTECNSDVERDTTPGITLPMPFTFSLWTRGRCPDTLPEGRYRVVARWIIEGGMLPDKVIRAESNIFTVRGPAYATAPKP